MSEVSGLPFMTFALRKEVVPKCDMIRELAWILYYGSIQFGRLGDAGWGATT